MKKVAERSLQERKDVLREAGLRSTGPRLSVLRELEKAQSPTSHADLAEKLVDEGYDRATVYRNLMDLTEAGLAARVDHGDHVWRFELVRKRHHQVDGVHPHFVCTECGEVSCLPETSVRIAAERGVPKAISQRAIEVQVKGACDACSL